jgi:hypothetical protein
VYLKYNNKYKKYMKPITLRVKENCSPLKQTTDPEKKFTAQGAGEQGQLQNISVTGKPGTTTFVPATRRVERLVKPGTKEYDRWKKAMDANPNLEADLGYKPKTIVSKGSLDVKIEEPKTEAIQGTTSDVFRTFDQRKYGAGGRLEKIQQRQERKAGRQEERRLNRAARKGAIDKNSQEYKDQLLAAKKKRYGQGEIAKHAREQMQDSDQAIIHREQITQKKTPRLSTYTKNFEVPTRAQAGGGPVKAPEGTKSSSDVIEEGKNYVQGLGGGSGSVTSGTKKGLFNPMNFSESVMGDKKSGINMQSSALKMNKPAPFKMKGYGKKGC